VAPDGSKLGYEHLRQSLEHDARMHKRTFDDAAFAKQVEALQRETSAR
jgi:hypothetical protein